MPFTIHETAAQLGAEYARLWEKDCGRFGEARDHFEVRVWDGREIVLRSLTSTAHGWHRFATIRTRELERNGYRLRAVFVTRDEDFVAEMKARATEKASAAE